MPRQQAQRFIRRPNVLIGIGMVCFAGLGALAQTDGSPEASPPPADAGMAYTISWTWPETPVVYDLVRTTVDTIPVPGKDPVVTRVLGRQVAHQRVEIEGGGADATGVRTTWEAIRFDEDDSLNEHLMYDSSIESHWIRASQPAIGSVAASLGQSVVLHLTPDGRAVGNGELEGMLRGIESNLTKWNLAGPRTFEYLQSVYTPETLRAAATSTYGFLPSAPLAVGASYSVSRSVTFAHVRTLMTDETHTLVSVERDDAGREIASFAITGTLRWPDPGGAAGEAFNVSLDKVTLEGAWSFDLSRGLVVESEFACSFLADIVRYDRRDRSSTEMSTKQSLTDRMTLIDTDAVEIGPAPDRP